MSVVYNSINMNIPSPPLSPNNDKTDKTSVVREDVVKSISINTSFPLPSLKDYNLKVNAWEKVSKKKTLFFLNQYYTINKNKSASTSTYSVKKENKRSSYGRRSTRPTSYISESSDSGSTFEKIRTRRITKERSRNSSSDNDGSSSTNDHTFATPIAHSPKKVKQSHGTSASSSSTSSSLSSRGFADLKVDYSPPLSTLPNNPKCLSTEWKGQPMNLRDDPLVSKLHPAEVYLASILRLPCEVYLDSKKRLFAEKVARMRKNLPFRRTDAQKACRIDVNKASRLFASFEKIGWLKDEHFVKFM